MDSIIVSGDILYLLPLGVGAVIYWLTTDKWPLWKNAVLSFALIALTAVALILLDPGFIAGNIKASIMLTIAYIVYLLKGPAKPLIDWLKQANMQKTVDSTAIGSDQPPANPNPVRVPTALIMPKDEAAK